MKRIFITIVVTFLVLIAGFYLYISSGSYNISQLSPHNSLTKAIIRTTKHNSINKRAKDIQVPENLKDSAMLVEGFQHYNEMCVMCHAAPGEEAGEMTEGLYPEPPKLYKHPEPDAAQQFFWVIKNGIKMTSMPAFGPTHDDQKIWAITAFVTQKLGEMTPEEYHKWAKKYIHENGDHDEMDLDEDH
ncbi:MAG TPA: cytochrome c [Sunxiuqinia sp.]|nr:cytochrome c [Sunxiuqinia sp.]